MRLSPPSTDSPNQPGAVVWQPLEGLEVIEEHLDSDIIPRRYTEGYLLGVWLGSSARLIKYRGKWQQVPPGTLVAAQAGEVIQGRSSSPFTAYKLVIKPHLWQHMLEQSGEKPARPPYFPQLCAIDAGLAQVFLSLYRRLSQPAPQLAEDRLLGDLITLSKGYSGPWPPREQHPAIQRARDYLHHHWSEEITLEDLAHQARLNKYDLDKLFHREVGITPHAYLVCLRLERAKERLAQGQPIARVALETGFADQSHLTRMLKRYWHLTPGQYTPLKAVRRRR